MLSWIRCDNFANLCIYDYMLEILRVQCVSYLVKRACLDVTSGDIGAQMLPRDPMSPLVTSKHALFPL